MKKRPILLSGDMVRAILDGRKTQMRRVVKPQPEITLDDYGNGVIQTSQWKDDKRLSLRVWLDGKGFNDFCPFGKVGDRLWVRETWAPTKYPATENYVYKTGFDVKPSFIERWYPSIHMPRQASRITLEITRVRVERLQDISEEDAIAEGFNSNRLLSWNEFVNYSAVHYFKKTWDSINAKKHPWDSNPWVWVIEFKQVDD